MAKIEDLKWDTNGLIPAVVQDAETGEVLTLAHMSSESLVRTKDLGETVFFSRSRQTLWHKGESSGHYQKVVTVLADCDRDALVVKVRPAGPACHTGAHSCFYEVLEGFSPTVEKNLGSIMAELEKLIADRMSQRPEGSYTVKLLDKGLRRVLQKLGEEAVETVIAGLSGDKEETVRETADLLFHLLVALGAMEIPLGKVAGELQKRRK
jgi:phosphoribosyl-ATP pyrophosphohydrolase/phosphoribosyl-AMP cyclohydrolase